MAYSIRMSEFREMSEEDREAAIGRLVEAAYGPPNGQLEDIEARIRALELRYETSSEQLVEELYEGARVETADITRWLWLLDLRERTNRYQTG